MPATTAARSAPNASLYALEGQTYLIGDEIFLRRFAPDDADLIASWTHTRMPVSPDRLRARLEAGEIGDSDGDSRIQLIIARRSDARPVGSLLVYTGHFPHHGIEATVDPLFGEQGQRWKGEAVALMLRHIVDEWRAPIASVWLRGDETTVIERIAQSGARESARFREMFQREGRRVDGVICECLDPAWVDRLGDPADRDLPRSGTGVARPVTPPVLVATDPPANAVRVGPRVYLRPIERRDAEASVRLAPRETDTNWSNGRYMLSAESYWHEMKELQKPSPQGWVRFAVCLRATDELIGFLGIAGIDYQHRFAESESEIINPAYRGGGYGSEAKHLLFDYAFNTLGLHMLQSWVLFENTRSAAALRKQGYRDAGRVHWVIPRDGTFTSMCTFDLLADEWRAMPRYPIGESES